MKEVVMAFVAIFATGFASLILELSLLREFEPLSPSGYTVHG